LPKNLEIHTVFLRFFGIGSQKICSPICALRLLVQLLKTKMSRRQQADGSGLQPPVDKKYSLMDGGKALILV
jgi:hypothetical protein